MYQLGSHRLLCGDSTKEEDVKKLMGGELADMIYCDPPYNIGLDYNSGISTQKFKGMKDNKKIEEYRKFINSTIENILKFSKPNLHIFYWCDENYIWVMQEVFGANEIKTTRVCLWIKNNFNMTPQKAFNKVYEPCVYGTIGKPYLSKDYKNLNEILNREVESGNQVIDEISDMINIWLVKRDNSQDYEHPTQKPLSLNQKPMKRCTKPNDIVVDLFGGSGSTLLAAEQIKRRCYMMEMEPIFCDVIIKRWETMTNKKAKLIK